MINRYSPNTPPELALMNEEITLVDDLTNNKTNSVGNSNAQNKTLSYYLIKIAQLGRYMNRKSDPSPGRIIM